MIALLNSPFSYDTNNYCAKKLNATILEGNYETTEDYQTVICFNPQDILRINSHNVNIKYAITNFSPLDGWEKYQFFAALEIATKIYVPSEYTKDSLLSFLLVELGEYEASKFNEKIVETGMPIRGGLVVPSERFASICFVDNGNSQHKLLFTLFKSLFDQYNFSLITENKENLTDLNIDETWKSEFDRNFVTSNKAHIWESKYIISFDEQCHWDQDIVEACLTGCTPLVPNSGCFPELLENDARCLYEDLEDLITKIKSGVTVPEKELRNYADTYTQTPERWK